MKKPVVWWLLILSWLIGAMVVFGGWVRLTRSGLSMVEWHVVTDSIPPLSLQAWEQTFQQYQQTPEYQQVNRGMSLDEYRAIYYREWGHRLLGRLIGLVLVLPLAFFLWRGHLSWSQWPVFAGIGLLFAAQALVGRFMVASGLVNEPHVSHYWLTFHLLCALVLLGSCLWLSFEGNAAPGARERAPLRTCRLSLVLLGAVVLQIALGGLMAGLKAGYLSATFPLIFGQWIPQGIWALDPGLFNLLENPVTVHFEHRWFAFGVLGIALVLWRQQHLAPRLRAGANALVILLCFQVGLGIWVILAHMSVAVALLHQALALGVFAASLRVCHRAFRG